MKIITASFASALIGLTLGLYIARAHAKREMNKAVEQMLQTMECTAGVEAGQDALAIASIERGEGQQAVRLLCTRIAFYYNVYDTDSGRDKHWAGLRSLIENLVRTNATVANEMTNHNVHIK